MSVRCKSYTVCIVRVFSLDYLKMEKIDCIYPVKILKRALPNRLKGHFEQFTMETYINDNIKCSTK